MARQCHVMVALLAVLVVVPDLASAQLTYASRGELEGELERRLADLGRAQERLVAAEAAQQEANAAVDASRAAVSRAEADAAGRASTLYRLTRKGALARYLLGSGTPYELLRRLGFLRHLSLQGLEARRRAGLELAAAEERLTAAAQTRAESLSMLAELREVVAELETELRQGHRAQAPTARPETAPDAKLEPVGFFE